MRAHSLSTHRRLTQDYSGELYYPNGSLAATVISGTGMGNGIVATDEIFYPSVYMTLQWAVDDTYAYVHVQGVGYVAVV